MESGGALTQGGSSLIRALDPVAFCATHPDVLHVTVCKYDGEEVITWKIHQNTVSGWG